jgi:hypothetical protein
MANNALLKLLKRRGNSQQLAALWLSYAHPYA